MRCHNPKHVAYERYHGRGIGLCEGWLSFENFYADMGDKPEATLSIERIDNEKGYTCGHCSQCVSLGYELNCRWANAKDQARNRRNNRYLTHNGETKLLTDWSRELGIGISTIRARLERGLSDSEALSTPIRGRSIEKAGG